MTSALLAVMCLFATGKMPVVPEFAAELAVSFDDAKGGVRAVSVKGDADEMNWVEGLGEWGTPAPEMQLRFVGARTEGAVQTVVWTNRSIRLDVRREAVGDTLAERYVFTAGDYPVQFGRGDIGIYTTFNDNYEDAITCQKRRCHAHLWCGGAFGGVRAVKMGFAPTELGLFLTEGTLDGYSVRRIAADRSNDRGDFILHPEPFALRPGESKVLSWKLVAYPEGEFRAAALKSGPAATLIGFEHETVFAGETFRIVADCAEPVKNCRVTANGRTISASVEGRRVSVAYRPDSTGEVKFVFEVNGRRHRAVGYVADDLATLVDRRVKTILRENQCADEKSPLDGAYLPYDNEEGHIRYDYFNPNHNAARERAGMALLVARWAQTHPSPELTASLERYERFLTSQIWEESTGEVYNGIYLREVRHRHYNAPWFVRFWCEMYYLTKKPIYLDRMEKGIRRYYERAGTSFYPVCCNFSECLAVLRGAGRDVTGLERLVRAHVDLILARGNGYPAQEVRFEQTLVTPPAAILADYCEHVKRDAVALAALSNHVAMLKRFDGDAPDHKLAGLPIRHWDAFWFGKSKLYGDTIPHYWGCLSANDYEAFARLTGDADALRRAERVYRNLLCLFFADGHASCAYVNPFTVTMVDRAGKTVEPARRGEFFDAYSNDQDFALYYALRSNCFKRSIP